MTELIPIILIFTITYIVLSFAIFKKGQLRLSSLNIIILSILGVVARISEFYIPSNGFITYFGLYLLLLFPIYHHQS